MRTAWLVRHAPTADNAAGVVMGSRDPAALPAALETARAIGADPPWGGPPDLIVSSPAKRALATARALGAGVEPVADPRLLERNFGEWEGRKKAELREKFPQGLTPDGAIDLRFLPPEGEPLPQLMKRVADALRDVVAAEPHDGTAVVVSHTGTLRAALVLLGIEDLDVAAAHTIGHLEPLKADLGPSRR
jgi:2,3-bisphosphoglycerate-dependent phosphoglycerate mutase